MAQREWAKKILKGEELFYYTLKLRAKLKEIEDKAATDLAEAKEELEGEITDLSEVVDANKQETDAAIEELSDEVSQIADNSLQLKLVAAAEYDEDNNLIRIYEDAAKQIPIIPASNRLYLVPTEDTDPATVSAQPNIYNEYIWNNSQFELIGATDVDIKELKQEDIENIWQEFFE